MIFAKRFTEHCVQVWKEDINTSVMIDKLLQNQDRSYCLCCASVMVNTLGKEDIHIRTNCKLAKIVLWEFRFNCFLELLYKELFSPCCLCIVAINHYWESCT